MWCIYSAYGSYRGCGVYTPHTALIGGCGVYTPHTALIGVCGVYNPHTGLIGVVYILRLQNFEFFFGEWSE